MTGMPPGLDLERKNVGFFSALFNALAEHFSTFFSSFTKH